MNSAIACGATLFAALVLGAGAPGQEDVGARMRAILDSRASSIVTVRAVIKTEMNFMGQSRDEESRAEAQGVVVDESGVIMMSNGIFAAPDFGGRMMRRMGGGNMEAKVTPIDIKVVFERDDKEHAAFLAATDTKLQLAFLKIKDLGDKKPVAVAFGDEDPKLEVGQDVYSVDRMGKGYDFAPFVSVHRIGGKIKKPRPAYVVGGPVGLPAFDAKGDCIGAYVRIEPSVEDADDGTMAMLRGLMGGGGPGSFLLGGKTVKAVVEQAKKKAEEIAAEAPADGAETKPGDGATEEPK